MKERSATAQIYRLAAKRIEDGESTWSCCAIERVVHGSLALNDWSEPTKKYRSTFSDRADGHLSITDFEDAGGANVRILALCFMASITERP